MRDTRPDRVNPPAAAAGAPSCARRAPASTDTEATSPARPVGRGDYAHGVPAGVFITFEGGEGVGKSTQARRLAQALRAEGRSVVVTREPGGSERAEQIRRLILADGSDTLDARTEALLFAAARGDHATHLLRPALDRGDVVISDRYLDSSVAYQGVARELGADWIRQVSMWATGGLVPALTIVLDLDVPAGLGRAQDRNRLERESAAFHVAVRQAFLDMAARNPERYAVISASAPVDVVAARVHERVAPLLGSA